jgi:hypothetical protein
MEKTQIVNESDVTLFQGNPQLKLPGRKVDRIDGFRLGVGEHWNTGCTAIPRMACKQPTREAEYYLSIFKVQWSTIVVRWISIETGSRMSTSIKY